MDINQVTETIIGCCIKIHKKLGPGLLESAYEACLAYELKKNGLKVEQQKEIPVVYEEVHLECGFRLDLLVEDAVVVELKAKEQLHPVDEAQVISYLRLLDKRVGLLVNFHAARVTDGVKRIVNDYRG
jgi:GxxExxY protein